MFEVEEIDKSVIRLAKKISQVEKEDSKGSIKSELDLLDKNEAFLYGIVSSTEMILDECTFPLELLGLFYWCKEKIEEGKSEEEVYKELQQLRKEYKMYEQAVYGSSAM